MGETIGCYGNRIAKGRFTIDGETYQLAINNARTICTAARLSYAKSGRRRSFPARARDSVKLHLVSPDGEENYPGTLTVDVTYTWTDRCDLMIRYEAATGQGDPLQSDEPQLFQSGGS